MDNNISFVVSSDLLKNKVTILSKVINKQNTIPILSSFLFEVGDNTLRMTASDGERMLSLDLPINDVVGEGRFAIEGSILVEATRSLPEQSIRVEVSMLENNATLNYQIGVYDVPVNQAEEYPILRSDNDNMTEVTVPSDPILRGVSNSLYAVSQNELRPILSGIHFDFSNQELTMVATDGYKLKMNSIPNIDVFADTSITIPQKAAVILKNVLESITDSFVLRFNKTFVEARFEDGFMRFLQLEGVFPNYRRVIPNGNNIILTIDRKGLISALKRVRTCANKGTRSVVLDIQDGRLNIEAKDLELATMAKELVPCDIFGSDIRIGFNIDYLIETLENMGSMNVSIKLSNESSLAVITPTEGYDDIETKALVAPFASAD